uniref:Uncharacterized protein n=1 Tax=Hemiselmis andersenii TaxID=464988 RepID=A0A6U5BZJ8_HEMAN|mmetsp:Transcript_19634/g.45178  ORF Transcript_19634/g.45178 Transcript_19634/m.45178 type:complete len:126 (-) Transcript_19634:244-621(-)
MQARTLLATLSVLQLIAICLNFTLSMWIVISTLPLCACGMIAVWIAIWCKWKTGIWIFLVVSGVLFGYALARMLTILHHNEVFQHPLDFTWFSLQCVIEALCILVGIFVLNEDPDKADKAEDDKN